jgi:hypothetical protein
MTMATTAVTKSREASPKEGHKTIRRVRSIENRPLEDE